MILFGSRAFGDHDERSDIDLAVCGRLITREDWTEIRESAYNANSLYWINLVHFDRNPPKLQERILTTGIKIYVKS